MFNAKRKEETSLFNSPSVSPSINHISNPREVSSKEALVCVCVCVWAFHSLYFIHLLILFFHPQT